MSPRQYPELAESGEQGRPNFRPYLPKRLSQCPRVFLAKGHTSVIIVVEKGEFRPQLIHMAKPRREQGCELRFSSFVANLRWHRAVSSSNELPDQLAQRPSAAHPSRGEAAVCAPVSSHGF